jgi:hypothetical protein
MGWGAVVKYQPQITNKKKTPLDKKGQGAALDPLGP